VNLVIVAKMSAIDEAIDEGVWVPFDVTRFKFSGCALASSILIINSPLCRLIAKMSCLVFSKYFLLYHGEAPP